MKDLLRKAGILAEALPYIRTFSGKTFVVKYGGAAQTDSDLKASFAQDIVLLNFIGIRPVIVHGGGPKISETMKKMGKEPSFVQGQRVTDRETMEIVEMVLGGLVNKEIVSLMNHHGGRAVGLCGKDGMLIRARKKVIRKPAGNDEGEVIDLGLVGEVDTIDPGIILALEQTGYIPVIAPIGVRKTGESLNINADTVASAVASALGAEKLILLTDVPGIRDMEGKTIPTVKRREVETLIGNGIVTGGMIPKVNACVHALDRGVKKTHIVDGRIPHCLLLEIFTEKGIGTEIVAG